MSQSFTSNQIYTQPAINGGRLSLTSAVPDHREEIDWSKSTTLISLVGQVFGRWTVLERDFSKKYDKPHWLCVCECGTERVVRGVELRNGGSKSCGCAPKPQHRDLIGQTFGRLTVLSKHPEKHSSGQFQWECLCECGRKIIRWTSLLTSGHLKSCGCLVKESSILNLEKAIEGNFNRVKDIIGQKFNFLTAISLSPDRALDGRHQHLFKCDCGKEKVIPTEHVTSGNTKSCGCRNHRRGPANALWKGNKKLYEEIRSLPEYGHWRKAVFLRDNFTCLKCGEESSYKSPVHAHHIIEFADILREYKIKSIEDALVTKLLWDLSNGMTVCIPCHEEIHGRPVGSIRKKREE